MFIISKDVHLAHYRSEKSVCSRVYVWLWDSFRVICIYYMYPYVLPRCLYWIVHISSTLCLCSFFLKYAQSVLWGHCNLSRSRINKVKVKRVKVNQVMVNI